MGKYGDPIFRPVKFEFGQVHIAGGYTAKPMAAQTKTIQGPDNTQNKIREDGRQ